jgi:hypothetical protein
MSVVDFRIIDFNYAFQPETTITVSSESIDFPSSNLKKYFRSKVWRTTGSFDIDATNNKIDLRESSGGPVITATVASGQFSPDALATALKTALEAVSVDTFTVSYSTSTGKWTISSSGTYLDLLFSTGPNAANKAPIGFGSNDYTGALTYTGAIISIHTSEWVVFDIETAEEIDSFAVVFDRVLSLGLTNEAVITLQASATNVWTSPAISVTTTLDEVHESITYFFETPEEYRYWRVKIVDPKNPALFIEIPKIILGRKLPLIKVPQNGFQLAFNDTSRVTKTEYGHDYVDVYPIKKTLSFNIRFLDLADQELLYKSFVSTGIVTPIAICMDSLECAFDKDAMFVYGKYESERSYNHFIRALMDTQITVQESL